MAYHGFYRAEGAPGAFFFDGPVNFGQGIHFHAVAYRGACAVRFNQFHGIRRNAGHAVGVPERPGLAFGTGGIDGFALAVGRGAHALEHGVDPVAVFYRVFQAFHGYHPKAFAQGRAVG